MLAYTFRGLVHERDGKGAWQQAGMELEQRLRTHIWSTAMRQGDTQREWENERMREASVWAPWFSAWSPDYFQNVEALVRACCAMTRWEAEKGMLGISMLRWPSNRLQSYSTLWHNWRSLGSSSSQNIFAWLWCTARLKNSWNTVYTFFLYLH